ncbi:uncharacterized protein LOC123668785 [Melitaea cinxia]|uniref:uncharacterized protein LOC123668785 n=1 Tax=Melitaea cinxia TaxID=113334 RepID=UPI001E273BD6|nr:uncharacterized protein LOC123668785 [Melitaea cinxia]
MKCAKLHLQERSKTKMNKVHNEKPRRFCQKRMVDPAHEEDSRWTDAYERFHKNCDINETCDNGKKLQERDDLFLSVQNLRFQGEVEQNRRPRTSFKYKILPDSRKHRMFVKQTVEDSYLSEARSSVLSDYDYNYTKYLLNNDQSRPSSSKSSIILYYLNNKFKENKATQVDIKNSNVKKKPINEKLKKIKKCDIKPDLTKDIKLTEIENNTVDTKITYRKRGKRKSLTISRTDCPATVQVIRVDVVCNYSSSSTMSDYDECRKEATPAEQEDKENKMVKPNLSHFDKKYVLTNTVKTLDENVTGAKVTLMCKTFKLTERSKVFLDRKPINPVTVKPNKKSHNKINTISEDTKRL